MAHTDTHGALDDISYLARSHHRVPLLVALATRPRSGAELRDLANVSSSTVRRTLREFETRRWVRKDGFRYEATELGAFVASSVEALVGQVETERKLRDVWHWLPGEESGFGVDTCVGAVVTVAESDDPYRPVNRFASLLRETDQFRFVGVGIALLEPCRDEFRRRVLDGMRAEIIDPPSVAEHILETYPDHCSKPLESDNFSVRIHDDPPPYGVCLFDRRVGVCGYDHDSGTVRVLIDSVAPEAREWAEILYESYYRESRPLRRETIL
ncbi:winged helix-turn-helix domain-containing protein [Haloprofundus sp. MHR1]|uniref:helix-turn-helix transcriptional regulator n=1 Tax=Haloprofundus sp. MHR1 TaxID=2572921 RepID=UPI0010BEFEE4|nr:MarR family transcriptional regulator [Haloprofundus sp. MHR1]QCJ47839.1 MarR family transcriptional regulator [Haloprofundus sp. MHR1]